VKTYRDDLGNRVFDLLKTEDEKERMQRDADEENRRLLYVAMTRAMFKLYVPWVLVVPWARATMGPIGSVLSAALDKACIEKLSERQCRIVKLPADSGPRDSSEGIETATPPAVLDGALFAKLDANLERRRMVIRSFSSLSRHRVASVPEGPTFGEPVSVAADEASGAAETDDPLRGPVFGDIVHRVLLAVDFEVVGRCETASTVLEQETARLLIEREVRANIAKLHGREADLETAACTQVAQLVWNALKTPLAEIGEPLWRIPPGDRLHELEFQFPEHPGVPVSAEVRCEDGFITGFIDLVLRSRGRYYLVDYKTNLLPAYTPDELERCMKESDYHRQYQLYLHALSRWLGLSLGRKRSAIEPLGGVYYLFVRGMTGRDETTGVFFHRPTAADIDLARIIPRGGQRSS
jgi:exodeoxyribonuclease V beta subunit